MSTPAPVPTTASWSPPVLNTDGSAILDGEITGYTVGVRDTSAPGSVAGTYPYSLRAPATETTELLSLITPKLPTGVTLAAAVRADTAGPSSDWSSEVPFTLPAPAPTPEPPGNFSIA